ncbi:hypothetical protein FGE12_21725 [Aggregicoccus sp. 17bor-14]|uniref:hypothetical protein n=1 Tax=Myxococcaceae TaxID=31 RepID=UPI00129CB062|nr:MULTISPECIES: hypothetical protein [Myxococcaceae]MBF5045037.1 hypothetical protein [Simulacricoccus sp. 17bor-14]MRI90779.1 hypothetical protein [Aggregicoccus sp. 17bor-14]
MKPASLTALLLLATACGSAAQPEPTSLGALSGRSVRLVLNDTDVADRATAVLGDHRVTVVLQDLPDGTCTRLAEGVSATLGGEPMRLERGGVASTPGRTVCVQPAATFDFDPAVWAAEPAADLEVLLQEAGQPTVRLRVLGGKAKRRFTIVPPTPAGTVRPGQTRLYTYAPGTDAGGEVAASLSQVGSSVGGPLTASLDPDGRVRVGVPTTVPAGTQELHLSRTAPATFLACEGLAACEGALFHAETVPVDIVP